MATKVEWVGTPEQVEEARAVREAQDLSYGELAKRYGLADGEAMREALAHPAEPEPRSKLEALVRDAKEREARGVRLHKGLEESIERAKGDPPLTEEELDQCEYLYRANNGATIDDMAAALDPPRHWLTVTEALGSRGWYTPDHQMLPYSTGTEEGQRRLAEDRAAGRITAAVYAKAHSGSLDTMQSIRI